MPDTIREQIIQRFAAKAQELTDIDVERCQRSIAETGNRFISVWDGDESLLESAYGIEKMQFTMTVECIFPSPDASIELNEYLGEIVVLFSGYDEILNELTDNVQRSAINTQYPQDGGTYTAVTVVFAVDYSIVRGDPYTTPN